MSRINHVGIKSFGYYLYGFRMRDTGYRIHRSDFIDDHYSSARRSPGRKAERPGTFKFCQEYSKKKLYSIHKIKHPSLVSIFLR